MKRIVYKRLKDWVVSPRRKPLLVRGARQVGKTHSVRHLAKSFTNFIEVNFEYEPAFCGVFKKNLDPKRILREISVLKNQPITEGKSLLFFDEIQQCPNAITALRYFYEKMPGLHVIAAGSLLEFAHELIGIPVGRVQSLYVYPMTFLEYLSAEKETLLIEQILSDEEISDQVHNKLLKYLGFYLALGGMPEIIGQWIARKDPLICSQIHATLIDTYKQDFQKYAKKNQIKYLSLLFDTIPIQLSEKFKYTKVGEYRKREIEPSLELLLTANILHKVIHSPGQGIPIGAESDPNKFKLIFIDVGLTQSLLNLDLAQWFVNPEEEILNKGKIVEAFVGQELLAYSDPHKKASLYYWQREARSSSAEIDYLIQKGDKILPIEVKSNRAGKFKSLHIFLDSHKNSPYGLKVSLHNHTKDDKIHSIPLYSLIKLSCALDIKDLF